MQKGLTCSTLLDLLHRNREDIKYFNDHLHKYLRQFGLEKASRISLETCEKVVHAAKDVEEHIMARTDILCRLRDLNIRCAQKGIERYGQQGVCRCQQRSVSHAGRPDINVRIRVGGHEFVSQDAPG